MKAPALLALTLLGLTPDLQPLAAQETEADTIVVTMSPCKKRRKLFALQVRSSPRLVLEGTLVVDGESFTLYLPRDKVAYSAKPRPKRKTFLGNFTSTYLAVDQDHDGKIAARESAFAEFPLRIGDAVFEVVHIDENGKHIRLRRLKGRLRGAVIGRKAPDFRLTTVDGRKLTRDDFLGRTLVIDCWSPG